MGIEETIIDTQLSVINAQQWSNLLNKWPTERVDIYDLPTYYHTWIDVEEAEPVCLQIDHGSLTVVYPFFKKPIKGYDLDENYFDMFSAYGYGGPLSNRDILNSTETEHINKAINQWIAENNIIAEFIRVSPYRKSANLRNATYTQVRTNVEVHLIDEKTSWANLTGSARRNIRSARMAGLESVVDKNLATLDKFQALYNETTIRLGMSNFYHFPPDYFLRVSETLIDSSFILNIVSDEQTVATALCFMFGNKIHYHLGCSAKKYLNLRSNDFLIWEIITHSLRLGAEYVELGGGIGADHQDSLFKFKKKFGNKLLPNFIGTYVHNQAIYDNLISQWKIRYPMIRSTRKNMYLRYRFAD